MKIMLNFLPLKTGGGVQVALDFLKNVLQHEDDHEWFLVCREGMPFIDEVADSRVKVVRQVKDKLSARMWFEYVSFQEVIEQHQPDVIYTQFGPQWPRTKVLQVVGCAYSNLFYPELNFWGALPFPKRMQKKFIDFFRLKRILAADVRIFETEDLALRARQQFNLDPKAVTYVRAAVSGLVTQDSVHPETATRCEELPDGYKVLLLSGYHPNKNIEFLVDVAIAIEKSDPGDDTCFVLTLPQEHPGTQRVMEKVRKAGVEHRVFNFGPVPQAGCCELYRACSAAVLPSTLESFSNVIGESWAMEKPLFISDLSWCRSLCNEGAVYYDFLGTDALKKAITDLKLNPEKRDALIKNGLKELAGYPSSRQRFESYLAIIEEAVKT